ncbi:Ribonuclease BN, tRNA processing enzyme [Lentibacillus persicus]|uniref:Ribonuclease BN, tRNA processing enzyme n=1 Tax=Lentibacillus persicus TaxID=640948 RepID=A0A1I1RYE7_9BACI|nr:MBL fold metallo-hydrolase [Lentibacillus persicus]SFD37308.1 Ribonuclease BN, tRNA processing enzyme [Lentibacillus persicus]
MKLTIIGYWGGYPAPGGATSAYLLEQDDFTLLIDAGSGALSKLQHTKHVMDLDAVILSHYHNDHVADIGVLQYAWLVQSYIRERNEILPIYGHTEDEEGFKALTHKNTEGIPYDPDAALEVGPFTITFLRTEHPVPCFGMRITDGETVLVYTADTAFKEEWYDFARDADFLITDCNFYEHQDGSGTGHMTSKEGAMIAEEANAGKLILSHLPQYGDNRNLVKEAKQYFSGSIQLAAEDLVWEKS